MKCIGCCYYRSLSGVSSRRDYCCHYLVDTGKLRKIKPSECYKHKGTPYFRGKTEAEKVDLDER